MSLNSQLSIINSQLIPSVRQHLFDAFLIAFGYQNVNIKIAFTFIRFLGQNMAGVRMSAFEFAARCRTKTLRRPFMCF